MKNIIRFSKWIIAAIPLLLGAWLAFEHFAIDGTLYTQTRFAQPERRIGVFEPLSRADAPVRNLNTGNRFQRIEAQPVYLPVQVPRAYEEVDVTIGYKNDEQRLIEFGVVDSEEPFRTSTYPLEVRLIDEAREAGWVTTTDQDMERGQQRTLLRRPVDTIDTEITPAAYIQELGQQDIPIATYQTDVALRYRDDAYVARPGLLTTDRILRGPHTFATYIKEEDLVVRMNLTDLNLSEGDDAVTIEVRNEDDVVVFDDRIRDTGDTTPSQVPEVLPQTEIRISDLREGVYTIRVLTSMDVVITTIETEQHQFVAKDRIFVMNHPFYERLLPGMNTEPTVLYGNPSQFRAQTPTNFGAQTLRIRNTETTAQSIVEIAQRDVPVFWQFQEQGSPAVQEITMEENDVFLISDGWFAFTSESFFDPDRNISTITEYTELADIDAILFTGYESSPVEGNFLTRQTVRIPLDTVLTDRKDLRFVLSAPGLELTPEHIDIFEVDMAFNRTPLIERLLGASSVME